MTLNKTMWFLFLGVNSSSFFLLFLGGLFLVCVHACMCTVSVSRFLCVYADIVNAYLISILFMQHSLMLIPFAFLIFFLFVCVCVCMCARSQFLDFCVCAVTVNA